MTTSKEELIDHAISTLKWIQELTNKLTSGNVSHIGCSIRGEAIREVEFLEKHKNEH